MPCAPRMCGPGGSNLLCVSYVAGPLITDVESRSNGRSSRSPLEHSAGRGDRGLYRPVHPPGAAAEESFPGFHKFRHLDRKRCPVSFFRSSRDVGLPSLPALPMQSISCNSPQRPFNPATRRFGEPTPPSPAWQPSARHTRSRSPVGSGSQPSPTSAWPGRFASSAPEREASLRRNHR